MRLHWDESADLSNVAPDNLFVMDTETTGLEDTDEVIELGWAGKGTNAPEGRMICRGEKLNYSSRGAQATHGITAEQMQKGIAFADGYRQMLDDFRAKPGRIMAAWNAPFDVDKTNYSAKLAGFDLDGEAIPVACLARYAGGLVGVSYQHPEQEGELAGYISADAAALLTGTSREARSEAHTASGDAEMSLEIFRNLKRQAEKLRGCGSNVKRLVEICAANGSGEAMQKALRAITAVERIGNPRPWTAPSGQRLLVRRGGYHPNPEYRNAVSGLWDAWRNDETKAALKLLSYRPTKNEWGWVWVTPHGNIGRMAHNVLRDLKRGEARGGR